MSGEQREPDQLDGVPLPEERRSVAGHAEALARMDSLIAQGRVPGGILIHGPLGIGKATFAFELARRIFLATGDETENQVFEQVASGGHPNLRVLRRAPRDTGKGFYTVIRVEDVREAVDRLHKTRGRSGHRVVVVDAIDDCNASSANALLKILEEPPADTVFLLVSHRPGQLLPTIKSRCHVLALRPIADDAVREVLESTLPGSEEADLRRAVELARGKPRRGLEALKLADAKTLASLQQWLSGPAAPSAVHLALADAIAADKDGSEARLAREMVLDWIVDEAKSAAQSGRRARLASANELWDKATEGFADADAFNLDVRQTVTGVFDAIRRHVQQHLTVAEQG